MTLSARWLVALSSMCFSCTGMISAAIAAESDPPRSAASRNDAQVGQSGAAQRASTEETLHEVVVTAQKREERLKDVTISISVLNGDQLDSSSAQGVTETLNRTPGVMAQESYIGGGTQITIRGVSASAPILHGSSPVAYYLDSVPFGLIKTPIAPDANAYDMERLEVLRGPQGTLYGASALNGVVRVLTKDADLDDFEIKGRASFSGTKDGGENYRGDAALNVPIVEGKLAARAVVGYQSLSGWVDRPGLKDVNDAELRNYRLKVNAQPTDRLSVGLSAWVSRSDYGAPAQSLEDRAHTSAHKEPMSTDYDAYGMKLGYDLDPFSVTSMTSYLDYKNYGELDLVPWIGVDVPFINQYSSHVFAQEVNFTSNTSGPWRWSAGAMYRDARDRTFQRIAGLLPADTDFDDISRSDAVFGEVTRQLNGGLFELTLGLRYFEDTVKTIENVPSSGVSTDPLINVASDFHKLTPRAVLTWHPNELVTTYLSYAEGFRSGFQQQPGVIRTAPDLPPVNADKLRNYEIGSKASTPGGRFSFDTAVYYVDWKDVQNDVNIEIGGGIALPALANSGSASGIGVDFATTMHLLKGLDLGLNVGWNQLEWDNAVLFGSQLLFQKGDRLNFSPEYVAGASADYLAPVNARMNARFSASANYTSKKDFQTTIGRGISDDILIARVSLGIETTNGVSTSLYVDNVTDEDRVEVMPPFGVPDWAVRTRPRTVGVQFEYRP